MLVYLRPPGEARPTNLLWPQLTTHLSVSSALLLLQALWLFPTGSPPQDAAHFLVPGSRPSRPRTCFLPFVSLLVTRSCQDYISKSNLATDVIVLSNPPVFVEINYFASSS